MAISPTLPTDARLPRAVALGLATNEQAEPYARCAAANAAPPFLDRASDEYILDAFSALGAHSQMEVKITNNANATNTSLLSSTLPDPAGRVTIEQRLEESIHSSTPG